jgi:hypothetical protein
MVGFCQIWIPNFGVIAKPLYEATKGPDNETLKWTGETNYAYKTLKKALNEAPALGILNLAKPLCCTCQKKRTAVGVLSQKLGTETHPVAYVSKKLDGKDLGWPGCLRVTAATALLVEEMMKITLGQQLEILTPHQVRVTLELKSHLWMSGEIPMTKYQAILLESPEVTIKTCNVLNPTSLN